MKVFVDTNVLIDYVCKREPFFVPAKGVIATCLLEKHEIVVSSLTIVNTLYIGRKYGIEVLKNKLSELSKMLTVADLFADIVLDMLKSDWFDYEDALQYATAMQNGANCIVTRNKKDFAKSQIPVYTPDEFLESIVVKDESH